MCQKPSGDSNLCRLKLLFMTILRKTTAAPWSPFYCDARRRHSCRETPLNGHLNLNAHILPPLNGRSAWPSLFTAIHSKWQISNDKNGFQYLSHFLLHTRDFQNQSDSAWAETNKLCEQRFSERFFRLLFVVLYFDRDYAGIKHARFGMSPEF